MQQSELDSNVLEILRIFVASWQHIPEHRRLPLFESLIKSASYGANVYASSDSLPSAHSFLWILIALLVEHTVSADAKKQTSATDSSEVDDKVL